MISLRQVIQTLQNFISLHLVSFVSERLEWSCLDYANHGDYQDKFVIRNLYNLGKNSL